MGQSLSEPKTDKETVCRENGDYMVAVCDMQGWRPEMEDAWAVQLPLSPTDPSSSYFAVFDGHGSKHFSNHCGKYLHQVLLENPYFCKGEYGVGLRESFHSLDLAMLHGANRGEVTGDCSHLTRGPGGTTAVVVLIKDNLIVCANAGDSRAITSCNGKVVALSQDHKPTLPEEKERIYRAGGWVEFNRVNGNLALSRALGDFEFKQNHHLSAEEQIVTADPDIVRVSLTPSNEFLVLACDGVWDVMTNEEVVEFIRKRIAEQMKPAEICESLLDHCLAPDCRMGGVGCDNMTIILICFLHGATYAELADRCSHPTSLQTDSSPTERGSCLGEEFMSRDDSDPGMAGMAFQDQPFDKELAPARAHDQNFDLRRDGVSPGRIKMAEFSHQSTDAAQAHSNGHKHQQSCTV